MKIDDNQLKGADGTLETVTVDLGAGPVRINKHEYDEEEHGKQLERSGSKKAAGSKYDDMTVEELKADLDRRKIEYGSDEHKADLVKKAKGK